MRSFQILTMPTGVDLKYGTPVTGSICIGIRSFTGGSLKCSGKKHDPGIKLASVSTSMSSDPTELVTLTLEPFATPSRSMSSGFIDSRPELGEIFTRPAACVDNLPE